MKRTAAARLVHAWYRPALVPLTAALTPLAVLFGAAAAVRRHLYRAGFLLTSRVPVPVVVVGNISVGGTGKTPLVRALAAALRERGHRPGVVSRGYGGTCRGPRVVVPGDDAAAVGDEPLLHAADGTPVAIGRDRVAAARCLLAAHPAIDVIVADDGLQHYALDRTVEVAVVDAARGLGNAWLLPAGPLREPAARLRDVDAIVQTAGAGAASALPGGTGARDGPPRYGMRLAPQAWRGVVPSAVVPSFDALPAGSIHAVAGIADPGRFFAQLAELGIAAIAHPFPDHHRFTAADLAFPGAQAVLMTEKDAVKCGRIADERMFWLPVRAMLDPALVTLIEDRMHGPQAA